MALAGSTIGLIRSFFNKANMLPQPEAIISLIGQAAYPQYGGTAAGGIGPYASGNVELQNAMQINNDLLSKYADFQDMCQYPECFTALNLYADEGTQEHPIYKKNFWIECEDETIKNILEFTFHRQLHIEDMLWTMLRVTAKYGNAFYELVVQDGVGVIKLISHKTPYMRRVQDIDGNLFGYLKDPTLSFKITTPEFIKRLHTPQTEEQKKDNIKVYEPWECVHIRMQAEDGDDLYGGGIMEGGRWAWKRLQQMEDAMVVYKISRSPQRYAFYVDVGDVPPNEARKILNQVKQDFKKQRNVDPSTGKLSFKYNAVSSDEDFFIARRKDKRSTEIEVLSGLDGQSVGDTEYFRNKLVAALSIPKAYLGYDDTVSRSNIGQQDIRFAKSVLRLQKAAKNGLKHIANVDLAARNIDPQSVDFDIGMTIPSGVLEITHIEVQKAKLELSQMYQGMNFSEHYIWTEILGLSDEEVREIQDQRSREASLPKSGEAGGIPMPSSSSSIGGAESPIPGEEETPEETLAPEATTPVAPKVEPLNKAGVQHYQTASKYRKIPKSSQLHESSDILNEIRSKDAILGQRLTELRHLVQEIRQGLNSRSKIK